MYKETTAAGKAGKTHGFLLTQGTFTSIDVPGGSVSVLQDLPLSTLHANAELAAEAVRCAGEQTQLWQLRDALLADNRDVTPEAIRRKAASIGVDADALDACTRSGKYRSAVQADARVAAAVGITGTPTFVIGKAVGKEITGVKVVGAVPIASIDAALAQLASQPSSAGSAGR